VLTGFVQQPRQLVSLGLGLGSPGNRLGAGKPRATATRLALSLVREWPHIPSEDQAFWISIGSMRCVKQPSKKLLRAGETNWLIGAMVGKEI